jgi:glutamine phosphoribosylpyrophosphate amidotransferase
MCGIVGVVSNAPVNQLIYDALLLLQHRGQDAAGIVTQSGQKFFMHKAKGMVRDVFRTRNMRSLPGNAGLGQVRYPTAGNAQSEDEAQPFYVNAPFGLVMAHNGNLTNAHALKSELFSTSTQTATPRCCSTCWPTSWSAQPVVCRCRRPMCLPPSRVCISAFVGHMLWWR